MPDPMRRPMHVNLVKLTPSSSNDEANIRLKPAATCHKEMIGAVAAFALPIRIMPVVVRQTNNMSISATTTIQQRPMPLTISCEYPIRSFEQAARPIIVESRQNLSK